MNVVSRARAARIAAVADLAATVAGDNTHAISRAIKEQYPSHAAVQFRSSEALRHDLLAYQRQQRASA